jgi:hypothetical protein
MVSSCNFMNKQLKYTLYAPLDLLTACSTVRKSLASLSHSLVDVKMDVVQGNVAMVKKFARTSRTVILWPLQLYMCSYTYKLYHVPHPL